MAVTVYRLAQTDERVDKRNPEATLHYIALRSTDEQAIRVAVDAASPATYYGLTKTSANPVEQGGGVWLVPVTYRLLDGEPITGGLPATGGGPPAPGGPPPSTPQETSNLNETFSFKTSGGTQHVTQAITTVRRVNRGGGQAPYYGGSIGVNKDKLDGVDVVTGKLEWSYSVTVPGVSFAYIRKLAGLVGCMNEQLFFHHEKGECLFLGASGQTKGPEGMNITYEFGSSPNLEEVVIVPAFDPVTGDATPGGPLFFTADANGPAKRGWDYLWVLYEAGTDQGKPGQKAAAAYVEQVYRYADFRDLGIGGG